MSDGLDAKEFKEVCAAIGVIVIAWSNIEFWLDILVAITYHGCGGNKIDAEIPRALKRKLQYLRKCHNKIPSLDPFRKDALSLFKEIQNASVKRHDLVHGQLGKINPKTGNYRIRKTEFEKHYHLHSEIEFDIATAPVFAAEVLDLSRRASRLFRQIDNSHSPLPKATLPRQKAKHH